jgi:hypothetical protein
MLASRPMCTLGWIAALLLAVLPCRSQTALREQLKTGGIPSSSFTDVELNEVVDGASAAGPLYVYFVYVRVKGEALIGNPHLVRYDRSAGTTLRSDLQWDEKDGCCGSPDGIEFVDEYLLISFHDTPSASSVLILDQKLTLVEILYGFGIVRVAPDQIVLTENMRHFAPVHPERLEFVDLDTGAAKELYPPKGDALRKNFAREHRAHIPTEEICKQLEDDPCDPEQYDEDITILGSDGKGRFALAVNRDAFHATQKDEAPVDVASQSALYLYERGKGGWQYCENKISREESKVMVSEHDGYDKVKTACVPDLPVVVDMSTSDSSPYPMPVRRAK